MKMFDVEQVKALNDLERMVYEYVVKDPEKVKYMRIRELADEVHVSTSTILRFCKKMGCSGYSEFKLQLRDYQTRKDQASVRMIFQKSLTFLKKPQRRSLKISWKCWQRLFFMQTMFFW